MRRDFLNANQIRFELQVAQWPEDLFFVQDFLVEDYALSQSYTIQANVTTAYQVDSAALLGAQASLLLHWPPDRVYLHGIVQKIDFLGHSQDQQKYSYQILVVSPLHALKKMQSTRLFLQKNVLDIAQEILQTAGFSAGTLKIQTQKNYPIKPLLIQYQENTYDFFLRLLSEYGLFFWFEQTDVAAILWILDDVTQLPVFPDGSLPYRSESGQVALSGSVRQIYALAHWLPENINIQGYDLTARDYDQLLSATATNNTAISGQGRWVQSAQGLDNAAQVETAAQIWQQRFDGKREQFVLETNCPGLQVGQEIKLIEHPLNNYNADYRVVAMQLSGPQSHLRLLADDNAMPNSDKLSYQATALVWAASCPYRAAITTRPRFHHILAANSNNVLIT